jgi:anti-anti-sigma factor
MVQYQETEESLVAIFSGRLDTVFCQDSEQQVMERVRAAGGRVEFDLAKADYVASAFLRLCLQAAKALGKDRFAVVRVNPFVKKVFKIAGMDSLLAED